MVNMNKQDNEADRRRARRWHIATELETGADIAEQLDRNNAAGLAEFYREQSRLGR